MDPLLFTNILKLRFILVIVLNGKFYTTYEKRGVVTWYRPTTIKGQFTRLDKFRTIRVS